MNSSLLAGLGVGSGLVLLGFVGSTLVFPPEPGPTAPPVSDSVTQTDPTPASPDTDLTAPEAFTPESVEPESVEPEGVEQDPPAPEIAQTDAESPVRDATDPAPDDSTAPEAGTVDAPEAQETTPDPATDPDSDLTEATPDAAPDAETPAAPSPLPDMPDDPAGTADLADETRPIAPSDEVTGPQARLPAGIMPSTGRDSGQALPQVTLPQSPSSDAESPPATDAPAQDDSAAPAEQAPASLPGTSRSALPQIGAGDAAAPSASGDVPAPGAAAVTALERNSLYDGTGSGARMALVLSDPGLPMAMRRALAALDFPLTIALNPMDSSAPDAAEIYMDAGKEVLILATSIPDGATASDLDVTFNAYFGSLPMAVGVIDLPQAGFARNARLLNEVLPLLQEDGHGLVTFSGGLAQAARSAATAGVPHAEVFRIIDAGNDSAFTMRRFLDRAVFQASQMGQVIVFGDASNDVLMEAITMWREGSRLDQVALVPISGILRNLP